MRSTTNQSQIPGFTRVPRTTALVGKRVLSAVPTSVLERFLLVVLAVVIPLDSNLPTPGGASIPAIVFMFVFGYLVLCRPGAFLRSAKCPVFVAGYIFLATALVMEIWHGSFDFREIVRIFVFLLSGVAVAAVCRDRSALYSCMSGYVLASLFLAPILMLTLFGVLSGAEVTDYQEASVLRAKVGHKTGLHTNANSMAASLAQGTLVAVALAMFAKTTFKKIGFLGLSFVFGLAAFLPMSRSGVLILFVSLATIIYVYGALNPKVILTCFVLSVGLLAVVPNAVLTRLTVSTEPTLGGGAYEDSRMDLYSLAIEALPEYIWTGVGINAFYGEWGEKHGLYAALHNCYLHVSVLWGLPGLFAFLALVWQAYRCLPKHSGADPLRLCILGLAVSALIVTFFSHEFESKKFSLILGMLAGADLRIWRASSSQQLIGKGQGSSRNKVSHGNLAEPSDKSV